MVVDGWEQTQRTVTAAENEVVDPAFKTTNKQTDRGNRNIHGFISRFLMGKLTMVGFFSVKK